MKKNSVVRMLAMVLVLTLISTCAICSTFAKYITSDDANDTARVAKFGVVATVNGNLFGDSYSAVGAGNSIQAVASNHAITVTAVNTADGVVGDKLVAPGTKNETGLTFAVKGTPEVSTTTTFAKSRVADGSAADTMILSDVVLKAGTYGVMVPFSGTVTADNVTEYWKANGTNYQKASSGDVSGTPLFELVDVVTIADDYYPINWKLDNNGTVTSKRGATALTSVNSDLATAFNGTVAPNTSLDKYATLTWEWPFTQDNMSEYKANQDTILGDLIANAAADAAITSAAATTGATIYPVVTLESATATAATTILFKEVGTSNKVICAYTDTEPTAAGAGALQTAQIAVLTVAFDASLTVTQVD